MKPNNISDIEKLFDEKWHKWFKRGVIEREEVKQFYRSQIEQLLGRIDTEEIRKGIFERQANYEGAEIEFDKIANQIKLMKL